MFPIVKNAYFIIKKSFKIILKWLRIKKFEKFNFEKKEKWIWTQYAFPSISYHFRIPIIFDYLDFHCPTEVLAVGTIIFPVRVGEQFFFQYGLEFIETFNYKSLCIRQISTYVVLNKNSSVRESNPGRLHERRRSWPLYHNDWWNLKV